MNDDKNIINAYADPIEKWQIRHFVCKEMERQIHRYIKAMRGSKEYMLKFEDTLKDFELIDKEKAIARYIDLNRKVLDGLDFKIVLIRAMANYSDTYNYFLTLANYAKKFDEYLLLIKKTYVQFHKIIEKDGKFGLVDSNGNIILSPIYDFVRTCYVYVDDLYTMPIIAQKDGKMGLVMPYCQDTVIAPFKYDSITLRDIPPYFEAHYEGRDILLTTEGIEKDKD